MVRKIMMLLVGALAMCGLTGCGGSDSQEVIQPDVHTLSGKLTDGVKFEDSVEEISLERALKYYGIDSSMVSDGDVYMSTGATAEEMAVFEASSAGSASVILDRLTVRRDDSVKIYIGSKPADVSRLDNAVLYIHDNFVVYVVSDDSGAALGIIKEYLE